MLINIKYFWCLWLKIRTPFLKHPCFPEYDLSVSREWTSQSETERIHLFLTMTQYNSSMIWYMVMKITNRRMPQNMSPRIHKISAPDKAWAFMWCFLGDSLHCTTLKSLPYIAMCACIRVITVMELIGNYYLVIHDAEPIEAWWCHYYFSYENTDSDFWFIEKFLITRVPTHVYFN